MNSDAMRKKIAQVRNCGLIEFGEHVADEIEKLNRAGLRSLFTPLMKLVRLGAERSEHVLKPLFDFTKFQSPEKHGAVIREQVTLLVGTSGSSIFLVKVLDNTEVRRGDFDRHNFHSHKRVECTHGDHLSYTVGLKDKLLIFVAKIFGETHHFIYSIARQRELPISDFYRAILS
ncbi:hypothetical protein [Aestuariivirga sp.]|uniref:hypothetical protein n=1 Tax=Aestuariivirga sp. TaxID=2650926 RepID=UPI0039E64826